MSYLLIEVTFSAPLSIAFIVSVSDVWVQITSSKTVQVPLDACIAIIMAIQASKGIRTVFDEVICTQTSEADTMKAIESGAEKVTSVRRQLN